MVACCHFVRQHIKQYSESDSVLDDGVLPDSFFFQIVPGIHGDCRYAQRNTMENSHKRCASAEDEDPSRVAQHVNAHCGPFRRYVATVETHAPGHLPCADRTALVVRNNACCHS